MRFSWENARTCCQSSWMFCQTSRVFHYCQSQQQNLSLASGLDATNYFRLSLKYYYCCFNLFAKQHRTVSNVTTIFIRFKQGLCKPQMKLLMGASVFSVIFLWNLFCKLAYIIHCLCSRYSSYNFAYCFQLLNLPSARRMFLSNASSATGESTLW